MTHAASPARCRPSRGDDPFGRDILGRVIHGACSSASWAGYNALVMAVKTRGQALILEFGPPAANIKFKA
jgi:hypothetical protein